MSFRTEQIKTYTEQIKLECECILQDLETFEETKQYDEVFSMDRALERLIATAEDAQDHVKELDLECEDI